MCERWDASKCIDGFFAITSQIIYAHYEIHTTKHKNMKRSEITITTTTKWDEEWRKRKKHKHTHTHKPTSTQNEQQLTRETIMVMRLVSPMVKSLNELIIIDEPYDGIILIHILANGIIDSCMHMNKVNMKPNENNNNNDSNPMRFIDVVAFVWQLFLVGNIAFGHTIQMLLRCVSIYWHNSSLFVD